MKTEDALGFGLRLTFMINDLQQVSKIGFANSKKCQVCDNECR